MPKAPQRPHACAIIALLCCMLMQVASARTELDLSGPAWKAWHDEKAEWQEDKLFLPPVNLAEVPTNAPTGGWEALDTNGIAAAVPGTTEEYFQKTPGPVGDLTGVTWWWRDVEVPKAATDSRIILKFESVRMRAEVYVNHQLAGYDIIGDTPFECDLTRFAKPGEKIQLAIRVTDAGGNFDWHDKTTVQWGLYTLIGGHGFGGITGRVKLLVVDPIYIDDLYVQNQSEQNETKLIGTIRNTTDKPIQLIATVNYYEPARAAMDRETSVVHVLAEPGFTTFTKTLRGGKSWSPENPQLYTCEVNLLPQSGGGDGLHVSDQGHVTFGFRSFEVTGVGKDAQFKLNGKRIVLRSAISWGFFPINGIYATAAMAEKQIRAAKAFGLNMLNFHRAIGQPVILEKADELGLLYYQEPGNFGGATGNSFSAAQARGKLLRMIKRDRSHPSFIICNMANEDGAQGAGLDFFESVMVEAHKLDPSRVITRSSGLRSTPGMDVELSTKMHMLPFDENVYMSGWYDDHHAGGFPVWGEVGYRNPQKYYHNTSDTQEIMFWGEEGALSTAPRLGLIKAELEKAPHLGWDGQMYLDWFKMFDEFMNTKKLKSTWPDVDALCASMGNISMEQQGRRIEVTRINNDGDGYVINGWEAEILENHSGVVDCFRNPKGNPNILAYFNQPTYVAVMLRNQVLAAPGKLTADVWMINESNLKGPHKLRLRVRTPKDAQVFERMLDVTLTGGDHYGELLSEGIEIPIESNQAGELNVEAELLDASGQTAATGKETAWAVDWQSTKLTGNGAVLEGATRIGAFLNTAKQFDAAPYTDVLGKLDWVVAASAPNATMPVPIPPTQLRGSDGKPGVKLKFTSDDGAAKQLETRSDSIDLDAPEGAPPDPNFGALGNFTVQWEGQLVPPASGEYKFTVQASWNAQVTIDGKVVASIENGGRMSGPPPRSTQVPVSLVAGKPVAIKVDWQQTRGDAQCRLLWQVPNEAHAPDATKLLDRVKNDGTSLIILESSPTWMDLIAKQVPGVKYQGAFAVGKAWSGGVHFVKAHPLFAGLPVDCGMDWPYQAVVRDGLKRTGLKIEGEELVAGAFHAHSPLSNPPGPIGLGTAVGVIPYGKGKIIVSTLDIAGNLGLPPGPADTARKLLCNYISYAMQR